MRGDLEWGSIPRLVRYAAGRYAGGEAVVDGRQRISYAELGERVERAAAACIAAGVEPGDRVAVWAPNTADWISAALGAVCAGGVLVPLNTRFKGTEAAYVLARTRARLLFVTGTFLGTSYVASLRRARAERELPDLEQVVVLSDTAPEGYRTWKDFLAGGDTVTGEAVRERGEAVRPGDLSDIVFTSGTTGRPKGAMLTHGNLEANALNMLTAGEGMLPSDITLTVAPLFHIGGLALFTLPLLYAGGTVVVAGKFDPRQTLELIQREKVTVHFMVPAMWAAMTQVPDFDSYDLSRLRYLLCGGAPCPLPVIEFYEGKGLTFVEGFGMTELSPAALVLESAFVRSHAGSVGRPFLHVEARIVDERDDDVPIGTVGELVLRGPNVFAGYWGLPEASAETLRGGWFHSGDLARSDADGFVTLVDRKKDMIISGGENVYPIEVEQVLHRHPDIADVAVIGVPDSQWGETVVAVVVPTGESLDGDAVIAYCRERIAAFKCPRRVEVVAELPRNATGKLLKRELRAQYAGSAGSVTR